MDERYEAQDGTHPAGPDNPGPSAESPAEPAPVHADPVPPGPAYYDQTAPLDPAAPSYARYPGAAGPSGYPGYPGYPGGPDQPGSAWATGTPPQPRRSRHLVQMTAVAAAAAVVAAGVTWAVTRPSTGGTNAVSSLGRPLSTSGVANAVDPGLVDVVSTMGYQQSQGAGTGIVLSSSGEILTNNHIVNGATSISVTDVQSGRTYSAVVVGYDVGHDIAVLQLRGASGLRTAPLGSSTELAVGQKVVALGNGGGQGGTPHVATGHVTGLNASIIAADQSAMTAEHLKGLIQNNAPIVPGFSGGALADTAGQVIGINVAASSASSEAGVADPRAAQSAYAIPIIQAAAIASTIEAGQPSPSVHIGPTAFLGVQIYPTGRFSTNAAGAVLAGVQPRSPAAATGLAGGDVITSLGGKKISGPQAVRAVLFAYHPGDRIAIGWLDASGQAHTSSIVLGTGPAV